MRAESCFHKIQSNPTIQKAAGRRFPRPIRGTASGQIVMNLEMGVFGIPKTHLEQDLLQKVEVAGRNSGVELMGWC